jgi:hypothetical protein
MWPGPAARQLEDEDLGIEDLGIEDLGMENTE